MNKFDIHKDKIETPFRTPENYFEGLTGRIQEQVSSKVRSPHPVLQLKWLMAPAFMIILGLSIYFYLTPSGAEVSMDQLLAEVSDEQIEAYLELNNISEYEIAQLIENTDDLVETTDYLEGIEMDEADLESIIFDMNEIENTGS